MAQCDISRNHRVKGPRFRILPGMRDQRKSHFSQNHCAVDLQSWSKSKAELVGREGNLLIDLLFLRPSDR